jgi:CBS domain-containing protein
MTRQVISIPSTLSAQAALQSYFSSEQRHRAYPVVTEQRVVGMVDRATFENLSPEALQRSVAEFLPAETTLQFALATETCRAVALRLAASDLERLPVVGDSAARKLIGLVSRSDLLKPTRGLHEEETQLDRPLLRSNGSDRD